MRHADRPELTKSIGAIGSLYPEQGLAPTLQQVVDAAKQLTASGATALCPPIEACAAHRPTPEQDRGTTA